MKTIEAAKEYAHCIWESWKEDYPSDYECHKSQSAHDFKAGVAFAQRWIDVKDELPKQGQDCLFKNENCIYIGYYDYAVIRSFDKEIVRKNFTHWRLIEYE